MRLPAVAFALLSSAAMADVTYTPLEFSDLAGWMEDDHAAALATFRETCPDLTDPDWTPICALAFDAADARGFFEATFTPVLIEDGAPMLFTGYYEPELLGSRTRSDRFNIPLYSVPPEVTEDRPFLTRREIEETEALAGRGLEIAWLDDPVEAYFLQIQGSGRIRLAEGGQLRLGYAGRNGHPYRSIGQSLIDDGLFAASELSADTIKTWVAENPEAGTELLRSNPSFIFFREVTEVPADQGPLGAMNRSITPMRTIAVDPAFTPLGAPVWIERQGEEAMTRLMIAQDTGGAIKGAQRADIFFGTGEAAGTEAGRTRDPGRMVVLLPIQQAWALIDAEAP